MEVGSATQRETTLRIERGLRSLGLSMMLLLVCYPFFGTGTPRQIVLNLFLSLVFVSAIAAVGERRRHLVIGLALAVPWFILTWVETATAAPTSWISGVAGGLAIAFLSFTLVIVLDFVLRADRVTTGVLWGAVAIYMILGGVWFINFALMQRFEPASFTDMTVGAGNPAEWTDLLYYSFVTLTTLGFGDIVPTTSMARHFTVAEAVCGVLYLPIVISRLVGAVGTSSALGTGDADEVH